MASRAAHTWKMAGLLLWRQLLDCKSRSPNKIGQAYKAFMPLPNVPDQRKTSPCLTCHTTCIQTSEDTDIRRNSCTKLYMFQGVPPHFLVKSLLLAMAQK